jgi:hypothetical protein
LSLFGKRRSPSLTLAFLLLLSLLLSLTIFWTPQPPAEQQVAQQWLDHSLGWGRAQVRQLQAKPLQLLVVLEASPEQVREVQSALDSLLCLQPLQGEQVRYLVAQVPDPWQSRLPWALLLTSLVSYLGALRFKRQHPELRVDWRSLALCSYLVVALFGLGWAYAAQIGTRELLFGCLVLLLGERLLRGLMAIDSGLKLTPARKAAIFLMRLAPEQAAQVFKELGPAPVGQLCKEIRELPSICPEVGQVVERQVWRRLGQARLRPFDSARMAKGLERHFLKSRQPEISFKRPPVIRWTSVGLACLGWLSLASLIWAASLCLPRQRHALEARLSGLGAGRVPVYSVTRDSGETGLLVCVPTSVANSADVWHQLVESELSRLGMRVHGWKVSPPLKMPGLNDSSWLAPLLLLLTGWLVHRSGRGNRVSRPVQVEVKSTAPRRRARAKIYSCLGCDEVFVDEESLRRHEAVCDSYREVPKRVSSVEDRKLPSESVAPKPVVALRIGLGSGFLGNEQFRQTLEFRVIKVAEQIRDELGIELPDFALQVEPDLGRFAYRICYHDIALAEGILQPDKNLAIGPEEELSELGGTPIRDPIYGMPARWWDWGKRREAERKGCMVFDCEHVVATHLTETVRKQPNLFFGYPEFLTLLSGPWSNSQDLLLLLSHGWDALDIWFVLRGLLRERVSIARLESVWSSLFSDPQRLVWQRIRAARLALAPQLSKQLANSEKVIQVVVVDEELDFAVGECLNRSLDWPELVIPKRRAQSYLLALKGPIETLLARGLQVNLLVSPESRLAFRLLTEAAYPDLVVLGRDEIAPGFRHNAVGSVSMPSLT